ncbi:DnaA N-terminal domain-containing protein [Bacillus massiliglaciei]
MVDQKLVIQTPDEFNRDWLNERYAELIKETARKICEQDYEVVIR